MKIYHIKLTPGDLETLVDQLYEKGMELEDNGNEGDPTAAVLYSVAKQLRGQEKEK